MLITNHWSATGPYRLRDYHVEFARTVVLDEAFLATLRSAQPSQVDWQKLKSYFTIYKNVDLRTATDYGTWHLNHDPRDGSANIEVGALCMGGEAVNTSGSWGKEPYTIAHWWMHVGINARLCQLLNIDAGGSFDVSVEPSVLQNGPIFNLSLHCERAYQTVNPDAKLRPTFGYFIYSGDPDCRWDISVRQESDNKVLADPDQAVSAALHTASLTRAATHTVKLSGITDFWGLNGPVT